MRAKFLVALVLVSPAAAFAEPSLQETWPLCEGWSYKIEPYLAYTRDELTAKDAQRALDWLRANPGPNTSDNVMAEVDSMRRLEGYMLRYKAEQVPLAEARNSKAVAAFCSWVASKHAPE